MIDRKHSAQFVMLLIIFALGLFIFFTASDPAVKKLSVLSLAILYPTWGILHHYEHGHLTKQIVSEYLLVGLLVLVAMLGILN